jgi:hypothetical protein
MSGAEVAGPRRAPAPLAVTRLREGAGSLIAIAAFVAAPVMRVALAVHPAGQKVA